jgi:hypothetical protein
MSFDSYRIEIPGFATSLELVNNVPAEPIKESINFRDNTLFLVATLTLPNGQQPPWDLGRLELNGEDYFQKPADNKDVYANDRGTVVIVNRSSPARSTWTIQVTPGTLPLPVAVNLMAFHGHVGAGSSPIPPPPSGSTFKCRGCKITAKALALAIVAAAALAAIPAALIAAVAAYLGVGAIVAGAFIGSVIGDTADVIAEKLCKGLGMC